MSTTSVLKATDAAPRGTPLPESFSAYLDLVRWSAATLVMLYHLRESGFGSQWINAHLPGNGHAYVTIFFVLSGFVISCTNDRKRHLGPREYVKDRVARIYSVALPVLVLCLMLSQVFPSDDFRGEYGFAIDHPVASLGVNAVFLGNIWFLSLPPYLDGPYWSLSYEVIYYAAFGLWVFSPHRIFWLIGLALLAGPKILLLFPCWLIGVLLNRIREKWPLGGAPALLVAALGVCTPVILYALGAFAATKSLSVWIFGDDYRAFSNSVNFLGDYLTAIAFTVHLYGMYWLRPAWPARLTRLARWGASIAFSLYLFHMPVLQLAKRFLGDGVASNGALLATIAVIMFTCYLLALVTERKRLVLKRFL